MKRLRVAQPQFNTASDYDSIFLERALKAPDSYDMRRWKLLLKYYKGGKLADLGCLDSLIPHLANPEKNEVWAIDQAKDAIDYLAKRYPKIHYEVRDLYRTGFPDGFFDYTVLGEVLEHLEEPEKAIEESVRITRKNGWLAVSVPLGETEKGECDQYRHLWSFTMGDIIRLLKPFGDVKTKVIGSERYPVYKYRFPVVMGFCKKK